MASHPAISATSFPAMSSLTYEQLQQLYVKNKAELTKHVNEAVGVEEKFYGGHDWFVRWWESPLQQQPQQQRQPSSSSPPQDPTNHGITNLASSNLIQEHNGLEHQNIPVSEQSEAVNMVKNRFRRRLQRFNWVTGPGRQPDLERVLESSGFSCQEEEPVMCVDLTAAAPNTTTARIASSLDDSMVPSYSSSSYGSMPMASSVSSSQLPPTANLSAAVATATQANMRRMQSHPPPLLLGLPEGVVIEPMSSLGIISWVSAWAHGAPECDVLHWTKVYARVATSVYRDQFRMFAARRGSECIGTGYLHCHSGIASVHSLFVHPAHRRRGIGKALAAYAMHDARSLGYQVATLTATDPALGLLTRLGFKEFGSVKLYTWYPVITTSKLQRTQDAQQQQQQQATASKGKATKQELADAQKDMEKLRIKEAEEEGWELV
ncbi:acyl-CoA N-acyltransferase [Apiospora saccharicola]